MIIVLDTTETHNDLYLEGSNYVLLHSFILSHPARLIVPQIVVEETITHYRNSVAAALDQEHQGYRSLSSLVRSVPARPEVTCDLSEVTEAYKAVLQRRLKFLHAEQPIYTSVPIEAIVQRALSHRKPFDEKGHNGWRDAVLWETILQVLAEGIERVVLITRNRGDFGDHGHLAQDLVDDLKQRGLADDVLRVCDGLGRFVADSVKPHLEKLEKIKHDLQQGEFEGFDAWTFYSDSRCDLENALSKRISTYGLNKLLSGLVESPDYVDNIEEVSIAPKADDYEIVDVWNVDDTEMAVGMSVTTGATIRYVEERYMDPDEPAEKFLAEADANLRLDLTVILERSTGEVVQWELDDYHM